MSRKNNEVAAKRKLAKQKDQFYTGTPSAVLKKRFNDACSKWGIHPRGADVWSKSLYEKLSNNQIILQSDLVVGEIKCAASKSTIGFTLTQNQQHNGRILGDNFKMIVYIVDIDTMRIYNNVNEFLSDTKSQQQSITGFMDTEKVLKGSF